MNGTFLMELGKYVEARLGQGAWVRLRTESGVGHRLYLPLGNYPDQEADTLFTAAAQEAGTPVGALLEDFGGFIVPDLLRIYGFLIRPDWGTLDVIENTEAAIHEVIRRSTSRADPPLLRCERTGPEEVVITYASPRKMCGLAKGIAQGLAGHYHERIAMTERACMHRGAPHCEISVRLLA